MSEAEKQLHRHIKPLVIGSNPICRTHATVAQQVEQEKTLFRYSRTFYFFTPFSPDNKKACRDLSPAGIMCIITYFFGAFVILYVSVIVPL